MPCKSRKQNWRFLAKFSKKKFRLWWRSFCRILQIQSSVYRVWGMQISLSLSALKLWPWVISSRAIQLKPALYPFGFAFAIQKGIHFLLHSEYTRAQLQGRRMFVASLLLLGLDWVGFKFSRPYKQWPQVNWAATTHFQCSLTEHALCTLSFEVACGSSKWASFQYNTHGVQGSLDYHTQWSSLGCTRHLDNSKASAVSQAAVAVSTVPWSFLLAGFDDSLPPQRTKLQLVRWMENNTSVDGTECLKQFL